MGKTRDAVRKEGSGFSLNSSAEASPAEITKRLSTISPVSSTLRRQFTLALVTGPVAFARPFYIDLASLLAQD
jgi:hypothetical protein